MSKSIVVPDNLYERAVQIAAKDHVSVEEFVSAALASRVAAREQMDARAGLFSREEFERALDQVPDVEPDANDRL